MKKLFKPPSIGKISPFPFLILIFIVRYIQTSILSYDSFIGGPSLMLLESCETCLLDYFNSNSIEPRNININLLLDTAFAGVFCWTILHVFKNYCQDSTDENGDVKWSSAFTIPFSILTCLCIILLALNLIWNFTAFDFYAEAYSIKDELNKLLILTQDKLVFYKKSYKCNSITFLLPMAFALFFFFKYRAEIAMKSSKGETAVDASENTESESTESENTENENSASEIFWRVIASISITALLTYLLSSVDQGPTLVYNLVEEPIQLLVALSLFLIMGWMTIFNPFYVHDGLYRSNQFAIPESRKSSYLFRNSFDWSKLELNDDNIESMLSQSSGSVAYWQRLSVIMQSWFVIFVLCSLWAKIIYLKYVSLIYLFLLVPVSVLGSIWIFYKFDKIVQIKNAADQLPEDEEVEEIENGILLYVGRMNLLTKIFFVSLFFGAMTIVALCFSRFIHVENYVHFNLSCAIVLMLCLNIMLSILLVTRRKMSFFKHKNNIFYKGFGWIGNDRNGRIAQLACFILFLVLGFFMYYVKQDWIYKINPIIIMFSYIIVAFFFFQSIAAHRTQLLLSKVPRKGAVIIHAILRILLVAMLSLWLFNVLNKDPERHSIPLVPKYSSQFESEEKLKLIDHISAMDDSVGHYYMIANEGGGLRANLWSLLVLNELDKQSDGNFYNSVIATCGASGGAIGQGLYHIAKEYYPSKFGNNPPEIENFRENVIEKIGDTDFLSRDVFSLLYERQFAFLNPIADSIELRGDMVQANKYASLVYGTDLNKMLNKDSSVHKSVEQWWYTARANNKNHFPLPIMHATHIETGMEGIVCPLSDADSIFNGSHIINDNNLVDRKDSINNELKSISYLDALFLTNRFPLMSPVATIPGKGNYNDAGAFDNSGVSSLLDIMIYLEMKANEEIQQKRDTNSNELSYTDAFNKVKNKTTLIVIQNSKEAFLKDYYKKWNGQLNEIKSYENLSGNIKSATNTSAVKEFLNNVAEKKIGTYFHAVEYINLPYVILDKPSVDAVFGGQIRCEEEVWKELGLPFNRERIDSLSGEFFFSPPLGRVINDRVYNFMEKELQGPYVNDKIAKIVEPIKK